MEVVHVQIAAHTAEQLGDGDKGMHVRESYVENLLSQNLKALQTRSLSAHVTLRKHHCQGGCPARSEMSSRL